MFKIYGIILIIGIVGAIGFGAKYYYDTTQNKIAVLQDSNAKLELVAETNQSTINRLQEDNAKMNELSKELQSDLAEATKYKDELIEKLQKHDLTRLSLKKPGLIEKRINNGTKELFESFESLTGKENDKYKTSDLCKAIIEHPLYDHITNFIGWPMFKDIGGKYWIDRNNYEDQEYFDSSGHPTQKGHQKIADTFLNKGE